MENFLLKVLISALAIFLVGKATRLYHVYDFLTAFFAALVLALINMLIRPLLIILTLPLTIITFGIFLLFINGFCLMLVSYIVPKFKINGCLHATIAAIFISIVTILLEYLIY